MDRQQLLARIDRPWRDLGAAYAELSATTLTERDSDDDWSVKDLLAHVATWEAESLLALPLLIAGKRPPRYGGVDNFNAVQHTRNRDLTLAAVLETLATTHQRLLDFLADVPEPYFASETRFRHRLRLDTYGHYPEHTHAIGARREQAPGRR